VLADRADIIVGEVLAVVLVAADPAFPDLFIGFIFGRLWLNMSVIIGLGCRRNIG